MCYIIQPYTQTRTYLNRPFLALQAIADRLAQYVQAYTLYSSVRPYGVSTILGIFDKNGPELYVIEPSGVYYVGACVKVKNSSSLCQHEKANQGYYGAAVGKGKQVAKTEIEKLKLSEMTVREAVKEAARMYVASFHI